jgi:2-polyprenyl-6-methoxyphenol hydroxylase-like FAD-dependent oxidoreductase
MLPVDVLILGAGPAGTAAAIGCRTQGLSVRLIEPARFPRSAPGETLHPGVEPVLRRLGVWHELRRAMTIRPSGYLVRSARDRRIARYGGPARRPWRACQLLRAALDMVLLDRARALGAQVSQPCRPHGVLLADGRVRGVMTSEGTIHARVVVDATGRSAWLARRLGLASGLVWLPRVRATGAAPAAIHRRLCRVDVVVTDIITGRGVGAYDPTC